MAAKAGNSMDRKPFPYPLPIWFYRDENPPPAPADPPADPPSAPPADRTFTQDEVDRIVKDRLARAKVTPPSDYDELKRKAEALDAIEEANRTELEKAQKAAADAQAERDKIMVEARETRLVAAIIAEAAKPDRKVVDPEAVVEALTGSKKDLLELDDSGSPIDIAKAMDSLLEARPYLVAQEVTRGSADQGARTVGGVKQITEAELKTMKPEQIDKAHREGRLQSLLGARS